MEPLHYLVTRIDELEKVQLFDEPRRCGEAAKYANGRQSWTTSTSRPTCASSYFKRIHGIEKLDVLKVKAFTDFNKKFMGKIISGRTYIYS